jgi:hypothetical protein
MIDIVTVVFRDELPVLKLQAESVSLYCNHMCLHTIYVVINDDSMTANDIDITWWGRFSDRVVVIHRQAWQINYADNGWLTQQLLKLLAAEQSKSEWSMILDSKTIIVQPVELDRLFNDDGQLTWGHCPVFPVFDRAKQMVGELFQIEVPKVAGPAGIPFFFHNQTVRDMIQEVTKRTRQPFGQWFQDAGMITEFILYSGYLQYRDGTLDKMYTNTFDRPYQLCNICHNETEIFDQKFEDMLDESNLTVSIHRGAWKHLSDSQRTRYKNLLIDRGISGAVDL